MQATPEARLTTRSRPIFVLAVLIASALIPTTTLMAQKAVTPPMAAGDYHTGHNERSGSVSRRGALMYIVEFPPGYSSPIHRHNASSYVTGEKLILDSARAQI